MVFLGREGLKELGERREREELWDLQENRESKASREILALKGSRGKKVNSKIMIIMTISQVIFVIRYFAHGSASRFQNILTTVMTNIAVNKSTDHANLLVIEPVAQLDFFFLSLFAF